MAEWTSSFGDENWLASVKGIPVFLPAPGVTPTSGPSEDDMGATDPDTIIYVNLKSKKLPEKFNQRMNDLTEMLDLTHQWLDLQAGMQARDRKAEGRLPTDNSDAARFKRSDYRIKVIEYILEGGNCPWVLYSSGTDAGQQISSKKVQFHLSLLKAMIETLLVPSVVASQLEKIFGGLSDLIIKTENTAVNRGVYTLFHVFTYDQARDDMRASLRGIYYSISQDMKNVVVGKNSYEDIKMGFKFWQREYTFAESQWRAQKQAVKNFLDEMGNKKVRNPLQPPVPVD